jgi:uncharacterized membrane protein
MHKGRVEAFSDGVIAIIITIMVLELKVPHETDLSALQPLIPVFASYVSSFVFIAIYWNNHHHLLQAAQKVNGKILWANAHLLFWLSLIPFTTAWMGENHFAAWPVALYGMDLLLCAIAYYFLAHALAAHHGKDSAIHSALGSDFKGRISLVLYAAGVLLALAFPLVAFGLYVVVAVMWLIPDRRFEK